MLSIIQGPAADAATPTAAPTGKAELVTPSGTKPAAGLWFYCGRALLGVSWLQTLATLGMMPGPVQPTCRCRTRASHTSNACQFVHKSVSMISAVSPGMLTILCFRTVTLRLLVLLPAGC
jgi:hypothetical protein